LELNILQLLDEGKCWKYFRKIRWSAGLYCLKCGSKSVKHNGKVTNHPDVYKYVCSDCNKCFNDKTDTVFSGSHQLLKVWLMLLYFMGLNLSNKQIAQELNLVLKTCQEMSKRLRGGLCCNQEEPLLDSEVEIDEVYVVAGHKGQPQKVQQAERQPRRRRLKGARGRGTLANEKPPILGMVQRGGELIMRVLPNVKQETIKPIITQFIAPQTLIYTDEYNIYSRLKQWNYNHKTVCHSKGEYARDEDGDGFHEVHVNTQEGIWSLLRSWLRPHRGVSQEHLPKYVGFFQFVHNLRKRGKQLLPELFKTILAPKLRELDDFSPSAVFGV